MPNPMIQSFASRTGKPVDEVERMWETAQQQAEGRGYGYSVTILKRMLTLSAVKQEGVEVVRRRVAKISNAGRRIALVKTKSSAIPYIAYDLDDSILYCMFSTSLGKWYGYTVPHKIWDGMAKAQSVGQFFATSVKPKYPYGFTVVTKVPEL